MLAVPARLEPRPRLRRLSMNRGADEARRRSKQRSGAMISLVVGPIILAVAAVKVFEPHEYPLGDIR